MARTVYMKNAVTGASDSCKSIHSVNDGLIDLDFCFVMDDTYGGLLYKYDASASDVESLPDIVTPTDSPATGRWFLIRADAQHLVGVDLDPAMSPSNNDLLVYNSGNTRWESQAGGGSGLSVYTCSSYSDCHVSATGAGVDFTWSGATQTGTFTIPAGVTLVSADIKFARGASGSNTYFIFNPSNSTPAATYPPTVAVWSAHTSGGPNTQLSLGTYGVTVDDGTWDRIRVTGLTTNTTYFARLDLTIDK